MCHRGEKSTRGSARGADRKKEKKKNKIREREERDGK
jgi:hypothetical protein